MDLAELEVWLSRTLRTWPFSKEGSCQTFHLFGFTHRFGGGRTDKCEVNTVTANAASVNYFQLDEEWNTSVKPQSSTL